MKKLVLTLAVSASFCYASAQSSSASNTLSGTLPASPTQYLGSANNADVLFKVNGTERMRLKTILNGSGVPIVALGIGTNDPLHGLHLESSILRLSGNTEFGGPNIMMGGTHASSGEWGIEYNPFTPGKEGLNFWRPAGGNYFLFLHNSGRVGINTNNPTAQFTVNGNMLVGDPATVSLPSGYKLYVETGILTEKVKVAIKTTGNWSDYVFEPGYSLMPLNSLEAYVTANRHLPNIPSAEEVVKEGVDLGEMTSKLLGKVEELTLYIIQQDKKINELQKEISEMQK